MLMLRNWLSYRVPQSQSESAELKRKLSRTLSKLRAVETEIQELIGSDEDEGLEWWDRRCHVLVEVYNRGGVIPADDWYRIGADLGYDRRGLGGFFTGNEPTMVAIAGNRHALSPSGRREAEEYLEEHPELRRQGERESADAER